MPRGLEFQTDFSSLVVCESCEFEKKVKLSEPEMGVMGQGVGEGLGGVRTSF